MSSFSKAAWSNLASLSLAKPFFLDLPSVILFYLPLLRVEGIGVTDLLRRFLDHIEDIIYPLASFYFQGYGFMVHLLILDRNRWTLD